MDKNKCYSMDALKAMNKCQRNREMQIKRENKEIPEVQASQFCVELLKNIMFAHCSREEGKKQLDAFFDMLDFPTEQTRQCKKDDMWRCICRYLNTEKRALTETQNAKVEIEGVSVDIRPDVMYFDQLTGTLEIIKFYYKKPDVTQNGRKPDHAAGNHMGLYSLLWYGEHLLPKDQYALVRASLYFLKQSTDKISSGEFCEDFFDPKGKNIISIENWYTGGSNMISFWDQKFIPLFQSFAKGSSPCYDKEYCQYCSLKNMCSYKEVPQPVTLVKNIARIDKIPYTPEQKQVINHMHGMARINAGAGSGKTLTVALRTVGLLRKGVLPDEICLLTFTESGAREMRERIELFSRQLGLQADFERLRVCTFNGFGNDIILERFKELGYTKAPRVADDVERSGIIAELLRFSDVPGLDYRNFNMQSKYLKGALPFTKKVFELIKSKELANTEDGKLSLQQILKKENIEIERETMDALFVLFQKYEMIMKQQNLIDYTDQELLLFDLYEKDKHLFENLHIQHIIVDEFQDSNERQVEILKLLKNTSSYESLMVVGDDAQSIYGFRDTSPEYIINFFQHMGEDGKDYFLLQNHRSTPEVIDFANRIHEQNKKKIEKKLVSTKAHGKPVVVQGFMNKYQEQLYVRDIFIQHINQGVPYENMAFIAATKSELNKMKEILDRDNIPCILLNPEPMLENPYVVASLDIIHFFTDPDYQSGIMSYVNALQDNKLAQFKKSDIEQLITWYDQFARNVFPNMSDGKKLEFIRKMFDNLYLKGDEIYESFYEVLKDKKTWGALVKYERDYSLYGEFNTKRRDKAYKGIVLTTAHSSKGLEWPVCIVSVSNFDSEDLHMADNEDLLEEKRRLFFVAATRAKDELYVTGQYCAWGIQAEKNYNTFLQEGYQFVGKDLELEVEALKKKK